MTEEDLEQIRKGLKCRMGFAPFDERCNDCKYGGQIDSLRFCDYKKIFSDAYVALSELGTTGVVKS